jgi:cell division protein FtsI/penicillin-binding protein 2
MLRIREDRQALARRIEVSRVAVGTVLSLLAVAYWIVQIVRGEYYFSTATARRSSRTSRPTRCTCTGARRRTSAHRWTSSWICSG